MIYTKNSCIRSHVCVYILELSCQIHAKQGSPASIHQQWPPQPRHLAAVHILQLDPGSLITVSIVHVHPTAVAMTTHDQHILGSQVLEDWLWNSVIDDYGGTHD